MKYQVNLYYSLQVEADNEEQAEEKAGEYMESEEGQGVRLSDMSIEVEEIGDEGQYNDKAVPTCGNCGRPATQSMGGVNRCERCV